MKEEQERAEFSYYGKLNAGDWFRARGAGLDIGVPIISSNDGSLEVSYDDAQHTYRRYLEGRRDE